MTGRMWGAFRVPSLAAVRKGGGEVLPPSFLCPFLRQPRLTPSKREQTASSSRASTSYATSHSLVLRGEERTERQERLLRTSNVSHIAMAAEDLVGEEEGLVAGKGKAPVRPRSQEHRVSSASRLSQSALQSTLLARTAVLDITKQPSDFPFSRDDEASLNQACAIYFSSCANVPAFLDTLLPELAKAYIHIGQDRGAVQVMRQQHEAYVRLGRSISLEAWRSTLVHAYSQGRFDTTAKLIRSSKSTSSPLADWAALAELDSRLRLIDQNPAEEHTDVDIDRFWMTYELDGRQASRDMFDTLTKSQLRRGRADLLIDTLEARIRHGHKADDKLISQLLTLHPKGRRSAIFQSLPDRLGTQTPDLLEALMRSLATRKDVRRTILAFRIFGIDSDLARSTTLQWRPTLSTFTSTLHMLSAIRAPDAVIRYLRLAALFYNKGDTANEAYSRVFKRLVSSLSQAGRAEEALAISFSALDIHTPEASALLETGQDAVSDVSGMPLSLWPRSYATTIDASSHLADPARAVETARIVLALMRQREVPVDAQIRSAMVKLFARVFDSAHWGQMASALDKVASEAEKMSPDSSSALTAFIEDMRRHGVMDRFALKTRFYEPRTPEDVRENLHWMTSQHNVGQSFTTSGVRESWREKRQVDENDEADALFYGSSLDADPAVHMREQLTSHGYALRIRVFAVVRGDHNSASIIYRRMLASGIKATSHHVAPIIEGLVFAGRLKDAKAVRDGARKTMDDLDGSMRIATAIVRGHARAGDWAAVREEVTNMRLRGIEPDITTWAAVGKARQLEEEPKSLGDDGGDGVRIEELELVKERLMKELKTDTQDTGSHSIDDEERLADLQALGFKNGKPRASIVTPVYRKLFGSGRFLQACQYMSRALDAGMVADQILRDVLRRSDSYLKTAAQRSGYVPPGTARKHADIYAERDEGKSDSPIARRLRRFRRRRMQKYWAKTFRLSTSNRHRASTLHPNNVKLRKTERRARSEMLELIFETFGNRQTQQTIDGMVEQSES